MQWLKGLWLMMKWIMGFTVVTSIALGFWWLVIAYPLTVGIPFAIFTLGCIGIAACND